MPKKHFSTTGSKCSVQTASECPQRKDPGRRGVPVTTAQKKTCNVIDKARQDVVTVDVKSPTSEPASNVHFQFCRAQLGTSEAGTLPSVLEWMEQPHYSPPDTLWGGATVIRYHTSLQIIAQVFYLFINILHRDRMGFDLVHPHCPPIASRPTEPCLLPDMSSSPSESNSSVGAQDLIRVASMRMDTRPFPGAWAINQWLYY